MGRWLRVQGLGSGVRSSTLETPLSVLGVLCFWVGWNVVFAFFIEGWKF